LTVFPGRVLVALLLALTARRGLAQESTRLLELDWQLPPECPGRVEVEREVLRLLGTSLPEGRRLGVRATVVRPGRDRWTLTLQTLLDGVSGERVLSGRSCRAVTDAAVLTLALTLNPELMWPHPEPRPGEPPPPAAPAPPRSKGPGPSRARQEFGPRWLGRTLVGLRVGTLPDPDPELGVGIGLGVGRVAAWLVASYAPPEQVPSRAKHGAGATLWMQSTALIGCYSWLSDPVGIAPCAGLELTRVLGSGYGVSHPRQGGVVYWLSPALGLAGDVRLERRLGFPPGGPRIGRREASGGSPRALGRSVSSQAAGRPRILGRGDFHPLKRLGLWWPLRS
jgi:hypothetical protein